MKCKCFAFLWSDDHSGELCTRCCQLRSSNFLFKTGLRISSDKILVALEDFCAIPFGLFVPHGTNISNIYCLSIFYDAWKLYRTIAVQGYPQNAVTISPLTDIGR
jgi:hypothetical protein